MYIYISKVAMQVYFYFKGDLNQIFGYMILVYLVVSKWKELLIINILSLTVELLMIGVFEFNKIL